MSPEISSKQANNQAQKYVYFFGGGEADGNGEMKDVLGWKGAGLAEMTNAGLPVPPGFSIQTEACREYIRCGAVSPEVEKEMIEALARLEQLQGQKLGQGDNPLLVSVRSGAKFSMPGMMDTILNLGLNDKSVEALALRSNNPRFAADSYRRLIQMFGNVVLDIEKRVFDEVFEAKKTGNKKLDTDLTEKDLREVIAEYKKVVKKHAKREFPQDPHEQLVMARDAVFRSWNNERAKHYRRINNISDDLGTALNVQAMVFGNLGEASGTGIAFTRNPSTGVKELFGEFLLNAQGEDLVSHVCTPVPITELQKIMPDAYQQLTDITTRVEKHYKDIQNCEFTIQDGKVYLLSTRNVRHTGIAAVQVAVQMVDEGLITKEEAIFRVEPTQLYDFLRPRLDEKDVKVEVLAKGYPASPGAAVGQIMFGHNEAIEKAGHGKTTPVVLVLYDATPEDIYAMEIAKGILAVRQGMTHAAALARGMGKCCVTGASEIEVDVKVREMRVKGHVFKEGDWISLDGTTGRVIKGKLNVVDEKGDEPELLRFMGWAEEYRRLGIRANADTPQDAMQARTFKAEGIGLCRTEHMFFAPDRIPHMRAMILATTEKERRAALRKLLPIQRADFIDVFRAMDGLPVTIRTLDPPLHEFLPRREDLMVDIALLAYADARQRKSLVGMYDGYGVKAAADLKRQLHGLLRRVEELHELNPMLGHRGCRLGITYPEIIEMQARAIFEAAVAVAKNGVKVYPEVMIPMTATRKEMAGQGEIVHRVAGEVFKEEQHKVDYSVGTMIELPRAALVADEIAEEAQFFSFGINDLTQTTFGLSRDDVSKILPTYFEQGILRKDPFAVIDREGVGELIRIGIERGRRSRPDLRIGICGSQVNDPSTVEFCHQVGMDYVSCSPFGVLTARLAAAQAGAREKLVVERAVTKRLAMFEA
jgi:pyruvate,orthophosphate dikinase